MSEDADPNRLADADQIGGVAEPMLATSPPPGTPTVIVQTAPAPPARRPPPPRPKVIPQVVAVERMFPAQDEKIVVYRLRPDGPSEGAYVGTYAASELSGCVTIEQFLDKFVRPRLQDGYGDYIVKMVDALGVTKKHSRFTLERPAEGGGGNGHHRDPLLATAADLLRDLASSRGGATQQQIEELKHLLAAGGQPADANTRVILDRLDALARSGPKEENVERMLLTKLLKRVEELSDKPGPTLGLPSLSSAPTADPAQIARDVAREFADVFRQQQPVQPQMTMADVVALVEKMRPPAQAPPPDLMTQVGSMITLMEKIGGGQRISALEAKLDKLHEIMTQPNEQPSAIDTIKQVVEVAESLEKIGERRVSRGDGSFGAYIRDIFQGIPDVAREVGGLVDKAKQRELATTRRLLLQREMAARARTGPTTPSQSQPSQDQPAQSVEPEPDPYPDDFKPYLDGLVAADTDEARIKALLAAFQRLGKEPHWKPYFDRIVAALRARDRDAIRLADALLANLTRVGKLGEDQRAAIVKAIDRNFDATADRLFPR